MMVFRDVRQQLPGAQLRSELLSEVEGIHSAQSSDLENLLISVFLRASELECALTDIAEGDPAARSNESATLLARLTDLIAQALLEPDRAINVANAAAALIRQVDCPATVRISPPEGFCFYALHPFDYVECLRQLRLPQPGHVLVVGIRSMGTTLSAIVLAELLRRFGQDAQVGRITVRPTGHPYDRTTKIANDQREIIVDYNRKSAMFLVVDEGPGLSGSSFLSVGEALHSMGVPKDRIVFVCSRHADPDTLVAQDAPARWCSFNSLVASPTRHSPTQDAVPISGGYWRDRVFALPDYASTPYCDRENWPAVWEQLSPAKYLLEDSRTLFKYEGLGRYGAAVRERNNLAADSGFTVRSVLARNGFSAYPWINGRLMSLADLSPDLLKHVAEYLAFRSRVFAVSNADTETLEEMTRFNFELIGGREMNRTFKLAVERPVIADARMMPHEWMRVEETNQLLKLDCAAHGDNHFLPGPVDIAWDLAGVILEWKLGADAADHFLSCYEHASGDPPRARLQDYLFAYSAFQAGFSKMAASALRESEAEDLKRLLRDYERYRSLLLEFENERDTQDVTVMSRTPQSLTPPSPVLLT